MKRLREIAEAANEGRFAGTSGLAITREAQRRVEVGADTLLALLDVAEAAETVMAGVQLDDLLSDAGKSAALHDALDAALDRLREVTA